MAVTGQVTEQLSEHQMEGFLEGYLLTGRHGIWSSYESFVHVIDSMLNQHAKWLEATVREIPWRKPISSMYLLVSSHVWRQDHNGFSHQDPFFPTGSTQGFDNLGHQVILCSSWHKTC